jgi:hypothetical protein
MSKKSKFDAGFNAGFDAGLEAVFFGDIMRRGPNCWLWVGRCNAQGYGIFGAGQSRFGTQLAHRVHWILVHGPIAPGMVLDHLCHVRACVRLSHLELVTRKENTLRGFSPPAINARKTVGTCGHTLTEVTRRVCLTCPEIKRELAEKRREERQNRRQTAECIAPLTQMERIAQKYGYVPERFRGNSDTQG